MYFISVCVFSDIFYPLILCIFSSAQTEVGQCLQRFFCLFYKNSIPLTRKNVLLGAKLEGLLLGVGSLWLTRDPVSVPEAFSKVVLENLPVLEDFSVPKWNCIGRTGLRLHGRQDHHRGGWVLQTSNTCYRSHTQYDFQIWNGLVLVACFRALKWHHSCWQQVSGEKQRKCRPVDTHPSLRGHAIPLELGIGFAPSWRVVSRE